MDLKDDQKSEKFREQRHATSRYFESNAGHLFVNNINPFSTVGGHVGDYKQKYINKCKNDEFIDIFDNTPTKESNNTPSKEIVDEIMQNCPFARSVFMTDPYDEIHEALLAANQYPDKRLSQPIVSISTNLIDTQYTSCSKRVPKTSGYSQQDRFEEYNEDRCNTFVAKEPKDSVMEDENGRAEKTTYCRPLLNNMYNQEFVYKTMQRNAKLQKLVRKLVLAREREKQREAWNNYINTLKNKHRYYSNEPSRISPQYVPDEHASPEFIDDFYNTKCTWHQPNPCQHLLENFYGDHNNVSPHAQNRYPGDYDSNFLREETDSYTYDNNRMCYPTSSQVKLLRWNRERHDNQYAYDWRTRPAGRYYRGNTIVVERERNTVFDKIHGTSRPRLACPNTTKSCRCKNKICSMIRSSSIPVQTDNTLPLVNEEDGKVSKQDKVCCKEKKETYHPYKQTSTVHQGMSYTQDYSKQKQDINIPLKDETLNINVDGNVFPQEEILNKNTDVIVSPKEEIVNTLMDAIVPTKEQNLNENIDEIVPPKEQLLNKSIDAIVPPKEETKNVDVNVSGKEGPLKNSVDVNKQGAVKKDKTENSLEQQETLKNKFKKVKDDMSKLKDKIRDTEEDLRLKSLITIEEKIDTLMKSMNSIMVDIKAKKRLFLSKKNTAVSCAFISNSRMNLTRPRSERLNYDLINNNEYLLGMVQNSSRSLTVSEVTPNEYTSHKETANSKMDNIFLEEMKKSNKVKRDIEELLHLQNERSCSVQITFDMPTKERSTEVTDSLSKARNESRSQVIVKTIPSDRPSPNERDTQMTIAVNTDPLGLLALLRVSTETVKQLLSYMPNLNYNSYIPMLPMPSRRVVSQYICNICGAAFGQPSQLSDHIEQHNLGRTKNCCVCRHSLDLHRSTAGLFACRYCGQRFTRAYCCELHQQTCARQRGRCPDVASSHVLLQ